MWIECSHSSPSWIAAYPSFSWAPESRSAFTSVPSSTMPALEPLDQLVAVRGVPVRRDVARSDLALALALGHAPSVDGSFGLRLRRASGPPGHGPHRRGRRAPRSGSPRRSVEPGRSPWRIVPCSFSSHHSRVPSSPRMRLTGSMPSIPLERDERAGRDQPDHLAREHLLPAALVQRPLQREAARDVIRVALDLHRITLAIGGPLGQLPDARGARSGLAPADGGQQRAVADEIGVAADRRGEVAVVRRPKPA